MSRRFGRNQRRAARERIAALELAVAAEMRHRAELEQTGKRLLADNHELSLRLETVVRDVGRALGRNFFGLPVETAVSAACEIGHLDSDYGFRRSFDGGRIATMHAVNIALDEDCYRMRTHIRLKLGPARAVYAISDRALMHAPVDLLCEQIGRELARVLVAEFRKSRGVR